MLTAIPIAQGKLYLPKKNDTIPDLTYIKGLSIYKENTNIYNVSYTFIYNSENITYNAFVAFPQAFVLETTGIANIGFNTENIINEKYLSLIPPFLIEFYENELKTQQIQQIPYVGFVSMVYYENDVLFLMNVPYGVVVYSLNKNKFYKIKLPTLNIGEELETYSTMIGSTIYLATVSYNTNGTLYITILKADFTYSDNVFSFIYIDQIQIPFLGSFEVSVSVVGNIENVVTVVRYSYNFPVEGKGEVIYYVYNTTTNNIKKISTGAIDYLWVYSNLSKSTKSASFYGSYVYTFMSILNFSQNTSKLVIFSLNINTGQIETVEINTPNTYETFLQGNTLIIIDLDNMDKPIKQGNLYFLPLNYKMYELINSGTLQVQLIDVKLEKNILTIKGIVKFLENGNPCSGCIVQIYNAMSALGNQYGIKGQMLGMTTTDTAGNFSIQIQFNNNKEDLNIVIVAGV